MVAVGEIRLPVVSKFLPSYSYLMQEGIDVVEVVMTCVAERTRIVADVAVVADTN